MYIDNFWYVLTLWEILYTNTHHIYLPNVVSRGKLRYMDFTEVGFLHAGEAGYTVSVAAGGHTTCYNHLCSSQVSVELRTEKQTNLTKIHNSHCVIVSISSGQIVSSDIFKNMHIRCLFTVCFGNIFYETWPILIEFGTRYPELTCHKTI